MSESPAPTPLQPLPPPGAPTIDASGAITSDLLCSKCQYNLRLLQRRENCPECGQWIERSIHDAVAQGGPDDLSLSHISRLGRAMYLVVGALLPMFCCVLSATRPFYPPDWQYDFVPALIRLTLGGWPLLVFVPFMAFAIIGLVFAVWEPADAANHRWVRAAVYSGIPLSLHFLTVEAYTIAAEEGTSSAAIISTVFLFISSIAVGAVLLATRLKHKVKPRTRTTIVWVLMAGVLPLAVVFLSLFWLVTAASWTLAAYVLLSIRLWHTPCENGRLHWFVWPIWFFAWAGGVSVAIRLALIEYAKLPVLKPDCYVCTAAARGHRGLVRGEEVRASDGGVFRVSRQMQRLKAAEIAIAVVWPRGHRHMRRVYNALGPRLARGMIHPLLADAVYLSLKPFEWAGALGLRVLSPAASRVVPRLYARIRK